MDPKLEGILLGELKAFKEDAMLRLKTIEKKVDKLDKFKVRVTIIMGFILGTIEIASRVLQSMK